ncbi:Glycosyl transferase family 2 [Ruminococcaceae bacterium YRB3002]|nr:Glycosyl transferase family 2 [Ruminococcaceae bacterium YRB3002]
MSTTVSIILPAKDSGSYLDRCIESVLSQSYTDWELLIINDSSSDNTAEIAMYYTEKDTRISIHDSSARGVSAARNHGLELSVGDYLCFLDSDDILDPEFLSELTDLIGKENADIAQCSFIYLYDDGTKTGNKEAVSAVYKGQTEISNAYFSGMIGQINLASWGKIYRKELIKDIRFDETLTVQEDAFFTFQCCMRASKVVCISAPRYYYYQNPGSTMNRPFDGSKMQYFIVLDRELDLCSKNSEVTGMIMLRKLITALDLTAQVIRDDSGREYLGELRDIALSTSDIIDKNIRLESRVKIKLFLLRHFPKIYYSLLDSRRPKRV